MRALLTASIACLFLQQEENGTVALWRSLERQQAVSSDAEQKERLDRLCAGMRRAAQEALVEKRLPAMALRAGDDARVQQLFDIRGIVSWIVDKPCGEFGPENLVQDPQEPPIGMEQVIELIKMQVAPGSWEGEQTIEIMPNGKMLVNAPAGLQRQVAEELKGLEERFCGQVRAEVVVLAMPAARALKLEVDAGGALPAGTLERLAGDPEVKRLHAVDMKARARQIVGAVSGIERGYVAGFENGKPLLRSVRDGLAAEIRPSATGGTGHFTGRVRYRTLLGLDELKTADGDVQRPRFAEWDVAFERRAPPGRAVVISRVGPLPAEAGLPPFLVIVARFGL